jgi:uncharacterized membrane protein
MTELRKLEVNKAMRRRAKFAGGLDKGLATLLLSVVVLGIAISCVASLNIAIVVTGVLTLSSLVIFHNGFGAFFARMRKPGWYTRGGLRYKRVLNSRSK